MGFLYLYLVIAIAILVLGFITVGRFIRDDKEKIVNYSEWRLWLALIACGLIWPVIVVWGIIDGIRKELILSKEEL